MPTIKHLKPYAVLSQNMVEEVATVRPVLEEQDQIFDTLYSGHTY